MLDLYFAILSVRGFSQLDLLNTMPGDTPHFDLEAVELDALAGLGQVAEVIENEAADGVRKPEAGPLSRAHKGEKKRNQSRKSGHDSS